ncbi:MAG TPA: hypothetical protein VN947_23045 [Polyangia bacterium]|nr:hypothetical protein [Polyangia bacterium]
MSERAGSTLKKRLLQWALVALVATMSLPARAQLLSPITIKLPPIAWLPLNWKCVHANGASCASSELTNPWYKQVFITSTGFADSERNDFFSEFDRIVGMMTTAGSVWSTQMKDRLLFIGYFTPGGALGTPQAAFGGLVAKHPIRGYATSLSQAAVYAKIAQIAANEIHGLNPFTAGVLFDTYQTPVTANAAPPSFVQKAFGVAKFTRADLNERGAYITSHELAHAGLNYLDEYVEQGFEELNIRSLDAVTPLALFDWTWGGFVNAISDLVGTYDYNISEIIAANGNDNIALGPWPATVYTSGYGSEYYQWEGGMFFGRGTWHMSGNNLMNGSDVVRGPGDGFDYAHSPSQQRVINTAFYGGAGRPNDRLRNAGPKNGWPLVFGSSTHVMLYDGDKHHHFQPTRSYTVQVGWYDRVWSTCWAGIFPYPCYSDVWRTAQQTVSPSTRQINLQTSSLFGLANLVQEAVCAVGINEVPTANGGTVRLCDSDLTTIANQFLPTISFAVPYQDVAVPASQWLTTYWWRFSTYNGYVQSGWTGWSSFYRSL